VLACHRIRSRDRQLADDVAVLKILATLAGQLLQLQALVADKTRAWRQKNRLLSRALETAAARYGIIGTSPALLQALQRTRTRLRGHGSVLLLDESAPARSCLHALCTSRASAATSPSSRSTARRFRTRCSSPSCSGMNAALSPARKPRARLVRAGRPRHDFSRRDRRDAAGHADQAAAHAAGGTIVRLGGKREIRVAVRVWPRPNRDLAQDVLAGSFRRDLFLPAQRDPDPPALAA